MYSVHPGVVLTDLFRHWTDNTIIKWTMPLAQPFMKTPWYGAQTTLFCILEDALGEVFSSSMILHLESLGL